MDFWRSSCSPEHGREALLVHFPLPPFWHPLHFWFLFLNFFYGRPLTGLFYSSKLNNSNKTWCDLWQSTWSHFGAFIPFILPGWWVPDAQQILTMGTNKLPFLLSLLNMYTLRNSSTTSVQALQALWDKELQKLVHLLLALSIPSSSTELNHTLALCRLHREKSLVRGKKKQKNT